MHWEVSKATLTVNKHGSCCRELTPTWVSNTLIFTLRSELPNHIKHLFMWCEHFDSSLNNSAVCCFYLFTDFLKPGDFSGSTEEKMKIWPLAKYKMVDYYNTAVQSQYAHPHSCFPMCFIFWLPHHQYNSETFAAKKQNLTSKKSEIYLRTQ